MKSVSVSFREILLAEIVKEILERNWSWYTSCDVAETVLEFTYLGDRVGAGGRCEVAVTA